MLEMPSTMSFLFLGCDGGLRQFFLGQIFFGWDERLRQSFFGTSGFRYRHIQESFYPGRRVFSRKFLFLTRGRSFKDGNLGNMMTLF